eukprot:scaffold77940_cov20-Tisochrysis_lutea.AAC.6
MEIYKYLFWALFLLSFVTYFVQHLICAYYYKTQNLKRRYNAKWALVTGASSGARQLSPCSSDVLFEEFHDAFLSQVMCGTVCHHLFYAHCRDWQVHCLQIGTPGLERSAGSPGNSARCVLAHSCKSRTVVQMCEGVRSVKVQIQNRQKRGSSAACNLCIACLLASGRGKSQLGTAVPANLGGDDYLDSIKAATDDIPVQVRNLLVELVGAASYHIVFCNAGYLLTGFFFASLLKTWVMRVCCTSGQRFGTGAFQHAHYRPEFSLRFGQPLFPASMLRFPLHSPALLHSSLNFLTISHLHSSQGCLPSLQVPRGVDGQHELQCHQCCADHAPLCEQNGKGWPGMLHRGMSETTLTSGMPSYPCMRIGSAWTASNDTSTNWPDLSSPLLTLLQGGCQAKRMLRLHFISSSFSTQPLQCAVCSHEVIPGVFWGWSCSR